jgi:peptidoglycan/xylan/chitin deacetylase (PgdA/CDA1 family)
VDLIYQYAGAAPAPRAAAQPAGARSVGTYPPARGGAAWLLGSAGGWDGLRAHAALLAAGGDGAPVFVEGGPDRNRDALEKAGFRRRAARLRLFGLERFVVPARGSLPSVGDLAKHALARLAPPGRVRTRGPADGASLYLTFDDGPDPQHTPVLLDALAAAGARATFFVVGTAAERYPDLVRRIVAEGHTLGSHSYSHSSPRKTSARVLLDEVERSARLLAGIVGFAPRLFRPPRGQLSAAKLAGLLLAGQDIVLWNVDPRDFNCASADDLLAALRYHDLRGGDIVLLHDDHPRCAAMLPALARDAAARGLALRALPELP